MSHASRDPLPTHAASVGPCLYAPPMAAQGGVVGEASGLVYRSRVMHELITRAVRFAKTSATVLITGENGTGKELIARLIHEESPRSRQRFARVNCAALAENLVESELFGHTKGAFTGADMTREGRFEWARGGSVLLDEISEIGKATQAKLLRTLEENEIQRVGCNETVETDVRVIATSNRDLESMVGEEAFREDLFYRLNVLRLRVPPLRERVEDIPLLANALLNRIANADGLPTRRFTKAAMTRLCHYSWPGNIRQLRNVVVSATVLADGEAIDVDDLPRLDSPSRQQGVPTWMLNASLADVERHLILEGLKRRQGNKSEVARVLGITAKTLSTKVNRYREEGSLAEHEASGTSRRQCG